MADLSGELSRRNLESDAGRMRREARRLNRDGFRGAANEVALASARASLSQGGGIRSADEQKKLQEYQNRLEGGLANQRRSQLRRDAGITDAATGDQLSMRQQLFRDMQSAGSSGLTSEMRDRAENLGVTQAGWDQAVGKINDGATSFRPKTQFANEEEAIWTKNPRPGKIGYNSTAGKIIGHTAGGVPIGDMTHYIDGENSRASLNSSAKPSPINPAYAPPGLQWDNDSNSVPDAIQRPAESRINGMPAGQAIRESRQRIIDRDGGIDPITGKRADTSLVKQTEALRDVNRVLESRNRPPAPAPAAPSMTIGGAPVDAGKFRKVSPEESAARKAEDESALQLARGMQSGGAGKPTQPATDQAALDARLESATEQLNRLPSASTNAPASSLRAEARRYSMGDIADTTGNGMTPQQNTDRIFSDLDAASNRLKAESERARVNNMFAGTPKQQKEDAAKAKREQGKAAAKAAFDALPEEEKQRRRRSESLRRISQGQF